MSCGWGAADYFHNMPITLRCANVLSYTEERPPIFIGLRMYKRRPFYVPNMQRQTIGIGCLSLKKVDSQQRVNNGVFTHPETVQLL